MIRQLVPCILIAFFGHNAVACAEMDVTIQTSDAISNFFPGKPLRREVFVNAGKNSWSGSVNWRLMINQRTIASRSTLVELKGGERRSVVAEVRLPESISDSGVSMEFLAEATANVDAEPSATLREVHWILAENPFAERVARLKELPLTLFDPDGKTKAAFEMLEIPFEVAADLNGVVNCKQGVLILGEGTRYQDWRGVVHESLLLSRRGVSVICLAAAEKEDLFIWDSLSSDDIRAQKSRFARRTFIQELAPRISLAWRATGGVEASNLVFAEHSDEVWVRTTVADRGWPWLELRHERAPYPHWIYCGLGVIRDWNETPAARHFLVRMIDYVTLETPCKTQLKSEASP